MQQKVLSLCILGININSLPQVGTGQIYNMKMMKQKVLSLCILGINTKSLSQMVTDLWTFVCSIGYNEKIQLWPI